MVERHARDLLRGGMSAVRLHMIDGVSLRTCDQKTILLIALANGKRLEFCVFSVQCAGLYGLSHCFFDGEPTPGDVCVGHCYRHGTWPATRE